MNCSKLKCQKVGEMAITISQRPKDHLHIGCLQLTVKIPKIFNWREYKVEMGVTSYIWKLEAERLAFLLDKCLKMFKWVLQIVLSNPTSQNPQEKLSTLASICLHLVPSYPVIFISGCQTSILISRIIMMNPTHIYIGLDRDRIIKRIPIPVPGYP